MIAGAEDRRRRGKHALLRQPRKIDGLPLFHDGTYFANAVDIGERSAVQDVQAQYGMPVVSIANLDDLLGYLDGAGDPALAGYREKAAAYRDKYGVSAI